ncbi:hypothetical protein [Tautonia marina]|uniref:hypothetical protein n=1 Tax=Tautonia marina TaxID=2653855 RepID=UPI00126060A7|nr:hypothetical protein [Tautonia marina]
MAKSEPGWYLVPQAVVAPVVLSVVAIAATFIVSPWAPAALPFVWIGAGCAAPNLNLVNGCLAYVAIFMGFLISSRHEPLGLAIVFGAIAGYWGGVIEKRLRMRPYSGDSASHG